MPNLLFSLQVIYNCLRSRVSDTERSSDLLHLDVGAIATQKAKFSIVSLARYNILMSSNPLSILLVIVQLASLGIIFFTGPVVPSSLLLKTAFIGGVLLGIWSLWEMRKSKLQATPDVAPGSKLIKSGPYRYIRHPMYTGLLLITISILISYFSMPRLIAAVILTADLLIKTRYEEKLLNKYFKEYGWYSKHTWRLIPFVY